MEQNESINTNETTEVVETPVQNEGIDTTDETNEENSMTPSGHPRLHFWAPEEDDIFFYKDGTCAIARYDKITKFKKDQFCRFLIDAKHFVNRLDDILIHINYFIKFYDDYKEYVMSIFSIKYLLDTNGGRFEPSAFQAYVIHRVMTDSFMTNIGRMVDDLYTFNVDTDDGGNYKSTPKITNEQAKVILAMSFTARLILPVCMHYINISPYTTHQSDYILCFDKIFAEALSKLENFFNIPVFAALSRFIEYRIIKHRYADASIIEKKRQVHGSNIEGYIHDLIHNVILVKNIYKIDYARSVVSFIDGVVNLNYAQFKKEPFKSKPIEISAEELQKDSDDFLSHSEALEMSIYRIDESISLINEANINKTIADIYQRFEPIKISKDEFDFYYQNVKINQVSQMLLHAYFSEFFKDSYAINLVTRRQAIWLMLILKKFLQLKGMVILPQLCTASVRGKFKENVIKNRRFVEKLETSAAYESIIKSKYRYIDELNLKDPPIRKKLSTIINSAFTYVDYDPEINGYEEDDPDIDIIIDEFITFLSII